MKYSCAEARTESSERSVKVVEDAVEEDCGLFPFASGAPQAKHGHMLHCKFTNRHVHIRMKAWHTSCENPW
jgi:hypothetical protein